MGRTKAPQKLYIGNVIFFIKREEYQENDGIYKWNINVFYMVASDRRKRKLSELLNFSTLSNVLYSKNYRTQRFGNWICFRPQVRMEAPTVSCLLELTSE
jgi:hypothetical protein